MKEPSKDELARLIELSLVDAAATRKDVEQLCAFARGAGAWGVCVAGSRVELARALLEDSSCKVTALVGFPLGACDSDVKRFEAETAVDLGAQEIEAVVNIGLLKDGDSKLVLREMRDLVEAADERPVKLALETSLLSPEQIRTACELALDSGVQMVSTGTGWFAPATLDDIRRLRLALGPELPIKAGGVSGSATAAEFAHEGAVRIGLLHRLKLDLPIAK